MGLLEELRAARRHPTSVLLQFLLGYKRGEKTVHAFFEGQEDESFYVGFLLDNKPQDYALLVYRCGTKAAVYDTYGKIDWLIHHKSRVLFFVDKDLADILKETYPVDSNIFVTEYYSVENYLVQPDILRRVVRELIHETNISRIERVVRAFDSALSQYHRYALSIMAWIVFMRGQNFRPNLNNLEMSKLFRIDEDLKVIRRKLAGHSLKTYLEAVTGVITPSNAWPELLGIARVLAKTDNPKNYVRGKYEMTFFISFIRGVAELLNSARGSTKGKLVMRVQLNNKNAIEILGPRLVAPESLRVFLETNFSTL